MALDHVKMEMYLDIPLPRYVHSKYLQQHLCQPFLLSTTPTPIAPTSVAPISVPRKMEDRVCCGEGH